MWSFKRPEVHIVVVCTANICRSPAAEAFLRHHLRLLGLHRRVVVSGAGTSVAVPGSLPDPRVVSILAERGINVRRSCSTPLHEVRFQAPALVWVMEGAHLAQVVATGARLQDPPELFDVVGGDIPDPYFGNKAEVRVVLDRIESVALNRVTRLTADLGHA